MEYIIQGGQFLLGISILVVLHELGHFLSAKYFKTKVESFYLFFNPGFSLFKKKIGETEYGIGWLPLGGYVKIAGMIDESMDTEQMEKDPEPWEFRSKPAWQRLIIMMGGVIVNVIVAFFIYAMVLFTWGDKYIPANEAKYGMYCDSLMTNLGFQNGDMFVALDGQTFNDEVTYKEIKMQLLLDGVKEVTVKRNNQNINIAIPTDFAQQVLKNSKGLFSEEIPYIIDSISIGRPAEKAGLLKGDKLYAINNTVISGALHAAELMENLKNVAITYTVIRNNEKIDLTVTSDKDGLIGVLKKTPLTLFNVKTKNYSFFEAIPAGFFRTGNEIKRYIDQFKLIFSKEGVNQIGGFGTIAKIYGPVWMWKNFWEMTAMISIMLAVMNMLPIPALDGGHVMFLTYEMITGRKPNEKLMEYAQIAGMLLLMTFVLYANGMDVFRSFFK